jgi:hypothetical protein
MPADETQHQLFCLSERGGYEICSVCISEDDKQDDEEADEVWGRT